MLWATVKGASPFRANLLTSMHALRRVYAALWREANDNELESMKKPKRNRKPPSGKMRAKKRKQAVNAVRNIVENMDEGTLGQLRQILQTETDFAGDMFDDDPLDLLTEYIDLCARDDGDEDDKNEMLADLVIGLSRLDINANGGDREARRKIEAIHDLLDESIDSRTLRGADLMLTVRTLAEAGWTIPERYKQAVAADVRAATTDTSGLHESDLVSTLMVLADEVDQNPFELHDRLSSLVAALPPETSVSMLSALIDSGGAPVIEQAVVGFALSPDAGVARAMCEALAASAARTPVPSLQIERLVRMRPWLAADRQATLDAAIRAMRLNALPPAKADLPKTLKCYASACEGSGASNLFVSQKAAATRHYQIANVMTRVGGVADALVLRELPKSAMDEMVREMKSSMAAAETDLVGVARILGLAVGENCASGNPPPFKLVEVAESLGLGPIHPDYSSSMEIIAALLADLPPDQTNPAAAGRAHADMLDNEFTDHWFEVGEALEDLLYPIKGSERRVAKLLRDYLPDRRSFWARQCAISALALRLNRAKSDARWKQLALVGRDIASGAPLDQIPLMRQIAEVSVQVFEEQP
jgi:hypothetical protein